MTYEPFLATWVSRLAFDASVKVTPLDLLTAGSSVDRATVDEVYAHISLAIIPPQLTATEFSFAPIGIASTCVASTLALNAGLTLSEMGASLLGSPTNATKLAGLRWIIAPPDV